MDKETKQRTLVLIRCCLCVGGALGIVNNCLGIYFSPIASSLGVPVGRMSIIITLMSLATAFFAPVFVRIIRRIPISIMMTAGVLLVAAGFWIMSLSVTVWTLYIAGVIMGVGCCCFSNLPVTMILREWYGDRMGSVTGIAMGFGGIFGAVCNPLFSRLISSLGWSASLRVQSLILMVLVLPCAMTLKMNPKKVIQTGPPKKNIQGMPQKPGLPLKVMVILTIIAMCLSGESGMNSHFSALSIERGCTLEFSAFVLSAAYVANVSFKLIHGWIADRTSPYLSVTLCCAIGLTGTILLIMFPGSQLIMLIGAFLYGSYFSCSTVGTSLIVQRTAGEDYAKVYSRLTMFASISYALMTTFYGLIHDAASSYIPSLCVVAAFSVIALILVAVLKKQEKSA